jgi:acetoin utilization deacetylase AcuC-like enzyme
MIARLMDVAERHCGGRLVALHEGGYSELYVPFCGLAVIEQLSGHKTEVKDPFYGEVRVCDVLCRQLYL